MNPNVPRGAAVLLDYVGGLETARKGSTAYQTVIGHLNEKGELAKPITEMTLAELLAEQLRWVKKLHQASGAAGRYQIIRPTLRGLIKELALPLTAKFTPDLQDALGFALLKRRGYARFVSGELSAKAYGNELAKEWASLPLLAPAKRVGKRTAQRGESYYVGDGINKSLDDVASFERALSEALNEGERQPKSVPTSTDFPVKGDRDNEVVAQVQRRLKELGYTEIGNLDGDFGDLTEDTIILFQKYNGLPMTGAIDEALIVALAKAGPRVLSPARQDATTAEVREVVPEAKANWMSKVIGFWGSVSAGVVAFVNWLFGSVGEVRQWTQSIADMFGAIPIWVYALIFLAGGVWLYLNGQKGLQASVDAVQEGARR